MHFTIKIVSMTSYLFIGRLDREKGIDILIDAFLAHHTQHPEDILHICGVWAYTDKIKGIAHNEWYIIYHGRVWKEAIKHHIQSCDYMIMPSTFLETFGLTALESLMLGTPVIGNKKWWCEPFIHPLLHIDTDNIQTAPKDLANTLDSISRWNITKDIFTDRIHNIQKNFTAESRAKSISHIIQHHTVILMSDYNNKQLGGIETHLDTIQSKLHAMWYNIHLRQSGWLPWMKWKIQRLWHMFLSIYNWKPWSWLSHRIHWDGTIWYHSILRHIGWYTLAQIQKVKYASHTKPHKPTLQTMITYHDLGLFHPFPHSVSHIQQLPAAWSLRWRICSARTRNPLIIVAVIYKYILISLIHKQLRQSIDIHIVPSWFMQDIVHQRHPDAHCIILPHFIDMHR